MEKIGIPLKGGIEADLELKPDGSPTIQRLPVAMIDAARGISFAKAKLTGVHTGLTFRWKIWPSMIGGCRVKLVWLRDRCG